MKKLIRNHSEQTGDAIHTESSRVSHYFISVIERSNEFVKKDFVEREKDIFFDTFMHTFESNILDG